MDDPSRMDTGPGVHPISASARPSDSSLPQSKLPSVPTLPTEPVTELDTFRQNIPTRHDDPGNTTGSDDNAGTPSQSHFRAGADLGASLGDDASNYREVSSDAGEAQNSNDVYQQFTVDEFMNEESKSRETEQSAYMLRSTFQSAPVAFNTTFVDKDPTGDYDPVVERRALMGKRRSAKNQALHRERPTSTKSTLQSPTLVIALKFYTKQQKIADLLSRPPANRPQEAVENYKGYGLRRRENGDSLALGDRVLDGLPDDLTGHPMARGCYSCAGSALRCPLLDQSELTWPCAVCAEDGHDCQLIVEPIEKVACETCKGLRKVCSFTRNGIHKGPCELCKKTKFQCIAGPTRLAAALRTRLTYDRNYDVHPLGKPPRLLTIKGCKHCRENEHECPLEDEDNGEPCYICEMDGVPCEREYREVLVDGTEGTKGKKKKKSKRKAKTQKRRGHDDEAKFRNGDDEVVVKPQLGKISDLATVGGSNEHAIELSDDGDSSIMEVDEDQAQATVVNQAPARPATIRIRTSFRHPVIFQHPENADCSFCQKPSYPFLGLGPTVVTVEELPTGKGYREISGGHAANNGNTVLCTVCTVERLRVILCDDHKLLWLPNAQPTSRAAGAWSRLIERNKEQDPDLWCSLCNNMAAFKCDTVQRSNETGGAAQKNAPIVFGCGLRLCVHCRLAMQGAEGNLEAALETIPDQPTAIRPRGLRADFGLYKHAPDGLLAKFIIHAQRES